MPHALSKRSLVLAAIVAVTLTDTAVAQTNDNTRVGAINLSYVARMSKAGKAGLARLEEVSRRKSMEVDARASELQKQQTELQQPGTAMSARALADLRRAFDKSRTDFDRLQQDAKNEIESLQTQFEMEFRKQLAPVIDEVSKEKGLQFVFGLEQAAIVWWSPTVDISEEVVKRLDARQ